MGATKLRIPADGPFVQNADGAFFIPGDGFVMRHESSNGGAPSPLSGTGDTTVTSPLVFGDVQLAAHYEMAIELQVDIGDGWATNTVTTEFQYSTDNAAWTTFFTNPIEYGATVTTGTRQQFTYSQKCPPVQGSALTGVAEGDTLYFRAIMSKGAAGDGEFAFAGAPAIFGEIWESL
jgi:hypothetical protein